MDSGDSDSEYHDAHEEIPKCKYCWLPDNLMNEEICGCTNRMANICFKCLHSRIMQRHDEAPTNLMGFPVCAECKMDYRNIGFEIGQNSHSFIGWLYERSNGQITRSALIQRFSAPALAMIFLTVAYWILPSREENWYRLLACCWAIFILGYVSPGITYYQAYRNYQNRPPTEIVDVVRAVDAVPGIHLASTGLHIIPADNDDRAVDEVPPRGILTRILGWIWQYETDDEE